MSPEREHRSSVEGARLVGTLDTLLRVRQDMLHGRLFIHFGDALIDRLAGYVEGYRACMRKNRFADDRYEAFRSWLRESKKETPVEEVPGDHLRNRDEEHEQAIGRALDLVAEFDALHPERVPITARGGEAGALGGATGVLQHLLEVRQDARNGLLSLHLKEINAERFNAFIDGYQACAENNGLSVGEYVRFRDWLRDVKRALPAEGWPVCYLRDCQGDHAQAILKYLDAVAEFMAQHTDGS